MTDTPGYRKPRAFAADDPTVSVVEPSATEDGAAPREGAPGNQTTTDDAQLSPSATKPRLISRWLGLLLSAFLSLTALATGLWFARFWSVALAREDWVGWLATGLLGLLALAAGILAVKELAGFWRLSRLSGLRQDAEQALRNHDKALEQAVVRRLKTLLGSDRANEWQLARFREDERHMREPGQLLGLADTVLMQVPDQQARRVVFESARRVGVVTAVVPTAFISMLFVLSEVLRMVRRLAATYGGRPGFFSGLRLFWWVLAHIAATGAIALTEDLWGQFFGQDLARRVSRRLGEGAFNAALTARLGVAAIEVCRPLPYIAASRIRVRGILTELFPEINPSALLRKGGRQKAGRPDAQDVTPD
jgi:putative membrane protein